MLQDTKSIVMLFESDLIQNTGVVCKVSPDIDLAAVKELSEVHKIPVEYLFWNGPLPAYKNRWGEEKILRIHEKIKSGYGATRILLEEVLLEHPELKINIVREVEMYLL